MNRKNPLQKLYEAANDAVLSEASRNPMTMSHDQHRILSIIQRVRLCDSATAAAKFGGAISVELRTLVSQGYVSTSTTPKRDRFSRPLYTITDKGMTALKAHSSTATNTTAQPRTIPYGGTYDGAEMLRTCDRPGAYDAMTFPSLIGNKRVSRRDEAKA